MLVDSLSIDELEVVRATDASKHQMPAGQGFRNDWSLWEADSPLKRDAVDTYKIAHADDISGLDQFPFDCNVRRK